MSDETVTISRKKYNRLLEASSTLNALMAAGVDNWEGYSEALGCDDEEEDEDEE